MKENKMQIRLGVTWYLYLNNGLERSTLVVCSGLLVLILNFKGAEKFIEAWKSTSIDVTLSRLAAMKHV